MVKLLDGKSYSWWKEKAKRWTAGCTIGEAIARVKEINRRGFRVVINSIAGQSHDRESIFRVCDNYLSLIDAINKHRLNAGITMRSTNLGIDFSYNETKRALQAVLKRAEEKNVKIEVDMEERPYVEKTIKLISDVVHDNYHLRLCIQAGLKDIYDQVNKLSRAAGDRLTFRVVTGSCYKETLELDEPGTVKQFYRLMLLCGKNSAVGTMITERILCAKAVGMESQVLMGFENNQPKNSVDTIYAAFGDWKTNEGIRGYIQRREKSVSSLKRVGQS